MFSPSGLLQPPPLSISLLFPFSVITHIELELPLPFPDPLVFFWKINKKKILFFSVFFYWGGGESISFLPITRMRANHLFYLMIRDSFLVRMANESGTEVDIFFFLLFIIIFARVGGGGGGGTGGFFLGGGFRVDCVLFEKYRLAWISCHHTSRYDVQQGLIHSGCSCCDPITRVRRCSPPPRSLPPFYFFFSFFTTFHPPPSTTTPHHLGPREREREREGLKSKNM